MIESNIVVELKYVNILICISDLYNLTINPKEMNNTEIRN